MPATLLPLLLLLLLRPAGKSMSCTNYTAKCGCVWCSNCINIIYAAEIHHLSPDPPVRHGSSKLSTVDYWCPASMADVLGRDLGPAIRFYFWQKHSGFIICALIQDRTSTTFRVREQTGSNSWICMHMHLWWELWGLITATALIIAFSGGWLMFVCMWEISEGDTNISFFTSWN
jgi:hypothetical protein